jgi:hypothetical protein
VARPLATMIGGCLASWAAITLGGGSHWNPELALGMAGPLLSACVSWWVVERTHAAAPARVTGVMIAGFMTKMLYFGALVVGVAALGLRPETFVVSFAVYFIALHVMEAASLRRLFSATPVTR